MNESAIKTTNTINENDKILLSSIVSTKPHFDLNNFEIIDTITSI